MALFRPKRGDKSGFPRNTLRHFSDVAGYEGVFIAGPYPHWLLLTGRGEIRTHPMHIDGSVPCFTAFNNVNCPQGFIYFNKKVPGLLNHETINEVSQSWTEISQKSKGRTLGVIGALVEVFFRSQGK